MSSDLVLYRFFDADGGLLYIGVSVNVWHRFTEHRRTSEFFPEAAVVTLQNGFTSRGELLDAESAAIRKEKPRFNVMHNRPKVPKVKSQPKPRRGWVESDSARNRRIAAAKIPNPCGKPHFCGEFVHAPCPECYRRDLVDIENRVPRIDRDRALGAHSCGECPASAEVERIVERRRQSA